MTDLIQNENNANTMAMQIVQMSQDKDFDVSKLEKLMDLQERVMKNDSVIAFNQDFTRMQSEITTVTKSKNVNYTSQKTNVTTSYSFATLEDIVDTVRPVLQNFGFAVSFSVSTTNQVSVTCTLLHKMGHSIETTMTVPSDNSGGKNTVQAIGSSVSYLKRYTISSLLNIATRDDDDAQSSSINTNRVITTSQCATLEQKLEKLPKNRQQGFKKWIKDSLNVENVAEIQGVSFNTVLAYLNKAVA